MNKIFQIRRLHMIGTSSNKYLLAPCESRPLWFNAINLYAANHKEKLRLPRCCTGLSTTYRWRHDETTNGNKNDSTRKRRQHDDKAKKKASAIVRNKKIDSMGKEGDWKGILFLYQKESKDYNDINLSTTMSRLGRIKSFDPQHPLFIRLIDDLAAIIVSKGIQGLELRSVANVVHAIGKMKLQSNGARKILDFVDRKEHVLLLFGNTQSLANIAWAFGNVGVQAPNLFEAINEHGAWLVEEGNTQDVANTAWACATLGVRAPRLFSSINDSASWLVDMGDTQHVSNTAWAFATLDIKAPNLFSSINERAFWLVERGSTQDVTNTAWASATLGVEAPNLFSSINDHASWLVEKGNTQAVANTAWACAVLGVKALKLFSSINESASWLVKQGRTQEVANTAWACATLGIQAPRIFSSINDRASWLVKNGTPQAVANTAWAFATLAVQAPTLFSTINDHASWLVEQGNTQDVSITAWACATLGHDAPNLVSSINDNAARIIMEGTSQAISNIAWSFATLGYEAPNFFEAIEKHCHRLASDSYTNRERIRCLSNSALAFAKLGRKSMIFFKFFSKFIPNFCKYGEIQDIANTCYSIVILDLVDEYHDEFLQLWNHAISLDPTLISDEGLKQLYMAFFYISATGIDLLKPPSIPLSRDLKQTNQESWSQKDVFHHLADLGLDVEMEVCPLQPEMQFDGIPDNFLAIDIACRDRMIAIEFDGPYHFLKNPGTIMQPFLENGPTKAKRLFLERLGWTVINIPYFEWNNAPNDEKGSYLTKKLEQAGILV